MWKRLAFAIDAPPIIAYSASVEIRAEPAPYVAFLPHFLGAGSTPMTERPIAEKLFDGSPAFLHNRRFTGSAGSARGGRGSGTALAYEDDVDEADGEYSDDANSAFNM